MLANQVLAPNDIIEGVRSRVAPRSYAVPWFPAVPLAVMLTPKPASTVFLLSPDFAAPVLSAEERALLEDLRALSVERQRELREQISDEAAREYHKRLAREAFALSEKSLDRYWGNDEESPQKGV